MAKSRARSGTNNRSTNSAGQRRGASNLFRRRRIVEAIQLTLALGAGSAAFSPGDAAAQACPPAITAATTISSPITYTGVCDINAPDGALTIDNSGALTNAGTGTLNNNNNLNINNGGSLSNAGTLNNAHFLLNHGLLTNQPTGKLYNNAGGYLLN